MPFAFQMPEKRPEHLRWATLEVPNGSSHKLFTAGGPVGIYGHRVGVTKPCRKFMTDGLLNCEACNQGKKVEWRGYLPVFDDDDGRFVVLFNDEYLERILKISLHAPIVVSRATNPKSPVDVRLERGSKRKLLFDSNIPADQDIRGWLLVIWKDKELSEFLGKRWGEARRPDKEKIQDRPLLKKSVAGHNPATHQIPEEIKKLLRTQADPARQFAGEDAAPVPTSPEKNGKHG